MNNVVYRRMKPLLGTYVEVAALDYGPAAERGVELAFEAVRKVQDLLSFHDPTSDLSRLNNAAGRRIKLKPISAVVLRLARCLTASSGGLFNFTVGGALMRSGMLPDHGAKGYLDTGCDQDISLQGYEARLNRPVHITLDGIAKGFALDLAVREMKNSGVLSGWVNAGGDLRIFGRAQIPVQRREADGTLTHLGLFQNCAIATSLFTINPQARFAGQIISPVHQPRNEDIVCTVSAPTGWLADALTKVALLANDSQRTSLISRLGGTVVAPNVEGGS